MSKVLTKEELLNKIDQTYDALVIGGGHAEIEAVLAKAYPCIG